MKKNESTNKKAAETSKFAVRFWGVRGSYPVPGKETVKYGGNTACIEVEINGNTFIFDAGTGIIKLGTKLLTDSFKTGKPVMASIFFTHMHHDHNQGFPFFKPAYVGSSILYLFGPQLFQEDISTVLSRSMLPPFFPIELSELNSARVVHNIDEREIVYCDDIPKSIPAIHHKFHDKPMNFDDKIVIYSSKGYAHPKSGIFFFKLQYKGKSVVIATDTEGYVLDDQRLINFSKGVDLLIHDAQYTDEEYSGKKGGGPKQGFGHSTPAMALSLAKSAGIKKLVLFHHDPEHSDEVVEKIEAESRKEFPNTVAAYEGMEINLL